MASVLWQGIHPRILPCSAAKLTPRIEPISGFITLIGYIGLVYAFLGDLLIFNERLAWLEVLGISIVLCMNITLVCSKMNKQPEKSSEQIEENASTKEQSLLSKANNP